MGKWYQMRRYDTAVDGTVNMNRFEGLEFEIIGISGDGKEISKVREDKSPYSAEQKPMKQ